MSHTCEYDDYEYDNVLLLDYKFGKNNNKHVYLDFRKTDPFILKPSPKLKEAYTNDVGSFFHHRPSPEPRSLLLKLHRRLCRLVSPKVSFFFDYLLRCSSHVVSLLNPKLSPFL